MNYTLYYGEIKIGTIKYEGSDFLGLFGLIIYDENYMLSESQDISRVREYIKLQAQSCELIEVEHEKDIKEKLERINTELDTYIDLIESNNWYLVDTDGNKECILSPIIRTNNEINWRWNIRT